MRSGQVVCSQSKRQSQMVQHSCTCKKVYCMVFMYSDNNNYHVHNCFYVYVNDVCAIISLIVASMFQYFQDSLLLL